MKISLTFALILILFTASSATIINIPDDYTTIQQGIDASTDGDTVLVQQNIYEENIVFNGHNITVGSLFLTTGDITHIPLTIIDGQSDDHTVSFTNNEDSTAAIVGFTIRNGFDMQGGGIEIINSHPQILNNIIRDNIANSGGGIHCSNSHAFIAYNQIYDNSFFSPLGNPGGGICCENGSNCIIYKNHIHDNVHSHLNQ